MCRKKPRLERDLGLGLLLDSFPGAGIKYPENNSLKKKGLFDLQFKVQSIIVGESRWQRCNSVSYP